MGDSWQFTCSSTHGFRDQAGPDTVIQTRGVQVSRPSAGRSQRKYSLLPSPPLLSEAHGWAGGCANTSGQRGGHEKDGGLHLDARQPNGGSWRFYEIHSRSVTAHMPLVSDHRRLMMLIGRSRGGFKPRGRPGGTARSSDGRGGRAWALATGAFFFFLQEEVGRRGDK